MGNASASRNVGFCRSMSGLPAHPQFGYLPGPFDGITCARVSPFFEAFIMSKVCQVTGKRPMTGNTVSRANNHRRRRFLPNLHTQRFWLEEEKRFVTLRVSTRGLRTIEKLGVDAVVADLRAQGHKV